jgi:hypothetical protein
MKRSDLNYFIDIGMGTTFLITFVTGVIKFREILIFFARMDIYFPMYWINFLHDWIGLLMGGFVAIHMALHYKWIKVMTKKYI